MTYASVEDWLKEAEGYSLRAERLPPDARPWVETAWQLATERCEDIVREWSNMDYAQLRAGEMSAQERRTLKAVLTAILTKIQSK